MRQRDKNRARRSELLQTPVSKFDRNIRDQLGRMLGGARFDPARDIEGITVNRWAHGYAFTPNPLLDPDWKEEEKPWVIGRKPFGKIAIANSDASARAYTDVAIDQAWPAVRELLRGLQFDSVMKKGTLGGWTVVLAHRISRSPALRYGRPRRHLRCQARLEMKMRPFAEKCDNVPK